MQKLLCQTFAFYIFLYYICPIKLIEVELKVIAYRENIT